MSDDNKREENMALSDEGRLSIAPYLEKDYQGLSIFECEKTNIKKEKREFDDLDWLDDKKKKHHQRAYFEYMHGYPRELCLLTYKGPMEGEYPKRYVEIMGNVTKVRCIESPPNKNSAVRGDVTKYSYKSRRRFRDFLQSIDFNSIETERMAEITLTYHKNYMKDGKEIKEHLHKVLKLLTRKYPGSTVIWKMEYQQRGAPHFHLIFLAKEAIVLGNYLVLKNGEINYYDRTSGTYLKEGKEGLRSYMQSRWNTITEDTVQNFNSGIEVEKIKSPTGIPNYLVKYVAKEKKFNAKEYQHNIPDWIENAGRWWGCSNKKSLNITTRRIRITKYTHKEIVKKVEEFWKNKGLPSYSKHDYGFTVYFNTKTELQQTIYDPLLDHDEFIDN